MRARLHFHINNFSIAYRLGILSYLKHIIREQSETFYESFFIDNEKNSKLYSYATYFRNLKIKGDSISSDLLSITVSSSNVEFMIYLINGSQQTKDYKYKNMEMKLVKFELLKEKNITSSQTWFKTLSPILVESKEGKPLLDKDPNFESELNIIAGTILKSSTGQALSQPLRVRKSSLGKIVIKENFHQDFHGYLYFTGNKGTFLLEGHPRDLNFIYQNGIGLRRGNGFGCLEILS